MLEDIKEGEEYFDEDFFAFYEDVDLSARARLRGWECGLLPEARVYHIGGGTAVNPFRKNFLMARNRIFFIIKSIPLQALVKLVTPGRVFNVPLLKHHILNGEYSAVAAVISGWIAVFPRFFTLMRKRRVIISKRRISAFQVYRWFS